MPEIIRAALVQQAWTGDKESMTAAAVAHIATAALIIDSLSPVQRCWTSPARTISATVVSSRAPLLSTGRP